MNAVYSVVNPPGWKNRWAIKRDSEIGVDWFAFEAPGIITWGAADRADLFYGTMEPTVFCDRLNKGPKENLPPTETLSPEQWRDIFLQMTSNSKPPMNDWIKTSERKPTEDDLPVLVCPKRRSEIKAIDLLWCLNYIDNYSHWMPFKLPEPPKVEHTDFKTPEDRKACNNSFNAHESTTCSSTPNFANGFISALAHERQAIFELTLGYLSKDPMQVIDTIRKRCQS